MTSSSPAVALKLKIAGMDCGSCALTIENSMRQLPGAQHVAVSFTTETMEISGEVSLKDVEQRLRGLREELVRVNAAAKESAAVVELDQSRVGRVSRMDALQSQAMSVESNRRRDEQIVRIDSALRRLAAGEYGLCLECDEEIDPRRLEIDPAITLCIGCAEKASLPRRGN